MSDIVILYFVYMSASRAATLALSIHLPPPRRVSQGQWLRGVGILSQGHTETDSLVVLPARIPSSDVSPSEFVASVRPKVSVLSIRSSPRTTLWSTFDETDEITNAWTPLRPLYHDSQIHPTSLVGQQFVSGIFFRCHDKSQQGVISSSLQGNYTSSTKGTDVVQNQLLHKEVKPVSTTST